MITTRRQVLGRAAILAATGHHPYVRHVIAADQEPAGYLLAGATVWLPSATAGAAGGGWSGGGSVGWALGAVDSAVEFFTAHLAQAPADADQWLHLPRLDEAPAGLRFAVTRRDDWDYRWTNRPPPPQPGEDRVVRLTEADHPALNELIDVAFPSTTSRPGDTRVAAWYGVRDGDRLVACGADRSRGELGFLAGLTVLPRLRGQGLGAALTAAMARDLLARFDTVALGVYSDNVGAIRLYQRLGFTGALARTSLRLGPDAGRPVDAGGCA